MKKNSSRKQRCLSREGKLKAEELTCLVKHIFDQNSSGLSIGSQLRNVIISAVLILRARLVHQVVIGDAPHLNDPLEAPLEDHLPLLVPYLQKILIAILPQELIVYSNHYRAIFHLGIHIACGFDLVEFYIRI